MRGILENKKIIIIGSGIGGAGVAALLAKNGASPIVIERSAITGGKAGSYNRKGCQMEVGIHISPRGRKGPLADIAKLTGADVRFKDKRTVLQFICGDKQTLVPQALTSPLALLKIFYILKPPLKSLPGLIRFGRLIFNSKDEQSVSRYNGISAHELIMRYFSDPDLNAFLNYCSALMFVITSKEASAAQFLLALNDWFSDGSTAYPIGGYGSIPNAYLDVCRNCGGDVRLNETAANIITKDNRVSGVQTDKAFYEADLVVCNAGVAKTVELVGTASFSKQYVERISQQKDSLGAVVVKYALDKPFTRTPFSIYLPKKYDLDRALNDFQNDGVIPSDIGLYITSPTTSDPHLAPDGQHILIASTGVPADMHEPDLNKKFLDLVEYRMECLYPGLKKHTLWKQRHDVNYFAKVGGRGAGEAIGLAQSYTQDDKNRFTPDTPIDGLYVVGADTGNYGIGTERAALSALTTAELIMKFSEKTLFKH